jgi:hypothetical protein
MPHPNIPGGFKSEQARQAAMANPDQQMVDNATSAIASQNATVASRRSPVAKNRDNGRVGAIGRRLARMRGNRNG